MSIFDGDPMYERISALRDSGYDGPIDQDGNAAPDHPNVAALKRMEEKTDELIRKGVIKRGWGVN